MSLRMLPTAVRRHLARASRISSTWSPMSPPGPPATDRCLRRDLVARRRIASRAGRGSPMMRGRRALAATTLRGARPSLQRTAPSGFRHGAVERVGRRHRADQDQHDEAHALLAVVGAVGEADARCRSGSGCRGSTRAAAGCLRALRRAPGCAPTNLQHQQQAARPDEADQRRQQQRVADLGGLRPVDAAGAVAAVHQRVGDADADDRADQRVRATTPAGPATRCRGSR